MWQHTTRIETSLSPESLFDAIADVAHWPDWDPELTTVTALSSLEPGAEFWLKPKGGPRTRMTVETADRPTRFVDVAHLPLASLRTVHAFPPGAIEVTLELTGLLAPLWRKVMGESQAAGMEDQLRRFVAYVAEKP